MKISFITTVLNEEESIGRLLESLSLQTLKPDEIIIVDGGSSDRTVAKIKNQKSKIKNSTRLKIIVKKGNRSVGRNAAIKNSTGDIIVCSDAGCELDKNWIKNITKPFSDSAVDVVAGFYKGIAKNVFQKCLIPYVLVMPDRIDPNNFLPATRSVAFRKKVWEKIGGFDEKFSHNEDYVFAKKLKKNNFNIGFEKSAIVYWYPPETFKKVFIMFYRFAKGDAETRIFRPKVFLIFLRYSIGVLLIGLAIIKMSAPIPGFLSLCVILYMVWSISKNYKYVNSQKAYFYLPLLQFLSDFAVMVGTTLGIMKLWDTKKTQ